MHTKLTDLKRHLLILRTELEASRLEDHRKARKSDLTARLELKQQQLEARAREVSSKLRLEHTDVKEAKARLNQLKLDRLNYHTNLDRLRVLVAAELEKRSVSNKLVLCIIFGQKDTFTD